MPQVRPTIALELQLSGSAGAWTDVSADVIAQSNIIAKYGITGGGPLDRVADTGTMQFRLRNDSRNSGAKQGYYSPGHANARSGFDIGIGTRLAITYSGSTFYKWRGELQRIEPTPGKYLARQTLCSAVDWMDTAAKRKMRLEAVVSSQRADQAIATIVGNMTDKPAASSLNTGQDTFTQVFDATRDESTSVLRELNRLVLSELGYLYIKGDTSTGGVLKFEDRHTRPKYGTSSASLVDASMAAMQIERGTRHIYNRMKIEISPRETSAAASIIFQLQAKPLIAQSTCAIIEGRYTDPSNRGIVRVAGASMVAAASTTDYTMNSASDGSGTDRTSNFTVSTSYGGNSVQYELANTGTTAAYVTKLQARGRFIAVKEPVLSDVKSASSIASYGESTLRLNMDYQGDPLVGQDAANALLSQWKDPQYILDSVEFVANTSNGMMLAALQREPGDKITITETVSGLDSDFFINGAELVVTPPADLRCKWELVPAGTAAYWILGTVGSSELGTTTVLGY